MSLSSNEMNLYGAKLSAADREWWQIRQYREAETSRYQLLHQSDAAPEQKTPPPLRENLSYDNRDRERCCRGLDERQLR